MGRLLSAFGIVALTAGAFGCERTAAPPPEPPAGTIDGDPIARADFVAALIAAQGDAFFPRYVERRLAEREAEKAGIVIEQSAIDADVAAEEKRVVEGRFKGDAAAFGESLSGYGLDLPTWRRQVADRARVRLLVEKLLTHTVDEGRVKQLFELRYGKDGVQRRVSQILISTVPAASRLYTRADFAKEEATLAKEARATAEALRTQIDEGADFAALAREHSDDVSGIDGGDLGAMWSGRFGADFDEAVGGLEVGGLSPVIASRQGFHVAQVTGVRKGATYEGRAITVTARPKGGRDARSEEQRFTDALVEARAIKARLDGGEPFAKVAAAVSADPASRGKGGALGKFSPGRLGPRVDPVLETLPIGTVSEPVRTAEGYALVQLDSRTFLPGQDKKLVRHIVRSTAYARVKARKLKPIIAEKARTTAESLLVKAKAGEDFAALARAHSEDEASRRAGGRLGRFRTGALGADVDAALAEMKSGEVRLVKGPKGYHLIRLDAVVKNDFAAVRGDLEKEMRQRPVQPDDIEAYLRRLRTAADVKKSL